MLVCDMNTAKGLANTLYPGKILAIEEKSSWYTLEGSNKLTALLQKHLVNPANLEKLQVNIAHLEMSQADTAKLNMLKTFIRSEGEQYKALIGLAHLIPFYISRLKYNQALQQQLSKLPRWY